VLGGLSCLIFRGRLQSRCCGQRRRLRAGGGFTPGQTVASGEVEYQSFELQDGLGSMVNDLCKKAIPIEVRNYPRLCRQSSACPAPWSWHFSLRELFCSETPYSAPLNPFHAVRVDPSSVQDQDGLARNHPTGNPGNETPSPLGPRLGRDKLQPRARDAARCPHPSDRPKKKKQFRILEAASNHQVTAKIRSQLLGSPVLPGRALMCPA